MVYLFRSMGTVWGVAASSTLIQNILAQELPSALHGMPNQDKVSSLRTINELHLLTQIGTAH